MSLPACTPVSWQSVDRLVRELSRHIMNAGTRPDIVIAVGRAIMCRHDWCAISRISIA